MIQDNIVVCILMRFVVEKSFCSQLLTGGTRPNGKRGQSGRTTGIPWSLSILSVCLGHVCDCMCVHLASRKERCWCGRGSRQIIIALLGSGLDVFELFLNIKSRYLARPTYMLWKAIILRDWYKE